METIDSIIKGADILLNDSRVARILSGIWELIHEQFRRIIILISNLIWEPIFMPSDIQEIIEESDPPIDPLFSANKKELYLFLCKFPILVAGGKLSFKIDKKSGKKSYMLGAKALTITPNLALKWTSHIDPRFPAVAELKNVNSLQIQGSVELQRLSPNTTYVAYLVFDLAKESIWVGVSVPLMVSIRYVGARGSLEEDKTITIYLQSETSSNLLTKQKGNFPQKRKDGWSELEFGDFFVGQGDDGDIEMLLKAEDQSIISGVIVQGVELRPKEENSFRWTVFTWLFKSAAESVTACEAFAPSEFFHILQRSSVPIDRSSRSKLYEHLSRSILMDSKEMSFTLVKKSGKRSYILGASALEIPGGDEKWQLIPDAQSRFPKVAIFLMENQLNMRGRIETQILSPKTTYAVYLVFKVKEGSSGLTHPLKTSIKMVGSEPVERTVCLQPEIASEVRQGYFPRKRGNGWMEIEMGQFVNDEGDCHNVVEIELKEMERNQVRKGLIVEGIEVRPKEVRCDEMMANNAQYVQEPSSETMEIPTASNGNSCDSKRESGTTNIVVNHGFSRGLDSWRRNCCEHDFSQGHALWGPDCCYASLVLDTPNGGYYASITNRSKKWQGLEQDITSRVSPATTYRLSALVGVSGLQSVVIATLRLEHLGSKPTYKEISRRMVSPEQWVQLEGQFSLQTLPEKILFYLEGPSSKVELRIKSVVIVPAWQQHQHQQQSHAKTFDRQQEVPVFTFSSSHHVSSKDVNLSKKEKRKKM